jgi:hypothetical protein
MTASAQKDVVSHFLFLHLLSLETEKATCKKKKEMLLAYTISVQSGQNRDQMVFHKSQVNHASLNPQHAFKVCIKTHHQ